MDASPIGSAVFPNPSVGVVEGSSSSTGGETFTRLLDQVLGKAVNQQSQADQGIMDLAAGNTDNLHSVFLDVIKAELSVRTVLEVRNRLLEAYQQVMQMQV